MLTLLTCWHLATYKKDDLPCLGSVLQIDPLSLRGICWIFAYIQVHILTHAVLPLPETTATFRPVPKQACHKEMSCSNRWFWGNYASFRVCTCVGPCLKTGKPVGNREGETLNTKVSTWCMIYTLKTSKANDRNTSKWENYTPWN